MSDGRLQRLLRSTLQYARVRVEILEVELHLERARLGAMLMRGVALALSALLGLQLVIVLLLALSWNTPWRLHVIVALIITAAVVAAVMWHSLRGLSRKKTPRPISAVLSDLDQFVESLPPEPVPTDERPIP